MPIKRKSSFSTTRKFKKSRKWQYKKRRLGLRRSRFNIHRYKRWGQPVTFEAAGDGTTTWFPMSYQFSLGDVENNTELISLYDQYKIDTVVIRMQMLNIPDASYGSTSLSNNTYSASINATQMYPKVWYYRDHDDNSLISSLASMREIGKAKCFVMEPNKVYSFKIKPSTLRTLAVGNEVCYPKKIDCSYPSVPHYGFKFGLDTMGITVPLNASYKIRIEKLYYLKMFNSR